MTHIMINITNSVLEDDFDDILINDDTGGDIFIKYK